MRWLFLSSLTVATLCCAGSASATEGKIVKVLPHFLDTQGRHTKSPSLFDRDAYQAWLRRNPDQRGGVRYDVQWQSRGATGKLKLRVELRGIAEGKLPREKTIEKEVEPGKFGLAHWDELDLKGDDYKSFGDVTAWRVSLWDGEKLVAEQTSFLW
jgi:hypothetical protein